MEPNSKYMSGAKLRYMLAAKLQYMGGTKFKIYRWSVTNIYGCNQTPSSIKDIWTYSEVCNYGYFSIWKIFQNYCSAVGYLALALALKLVFALCADP